MTEWLIWILIIIALGPIFSRIIIRFHERNIYKKAEEMNRKKQAKVKRK